MEVAQTSWLVMWWDKQNECMCAKKKSGPRSGWDWSLSVNRWFHMLSRYYMTTHVSVGHRCVDWLGLYMEYCVLFLCTYSFTETHNRGLDVESSMRPPWSSDAEADWSSYWASLMRNCSFTLMCGEQYTLLLKCMEKWVSSSLVLSLFHLTRSDSDRHGDTQTLSGPEARSSDHWK